MLFTSNIIDFNGNTLWNDNGSMHRNGTRVKRRFFCFCDDWRIILMAEKLTCEQLEQRIKKLEKEIIDHNYAEKRLRFFSSFVEQTHEGMAACDLEYHLLFVNEAFAAMHGFTPEELVGQRLSVFHTPEQMPWVEAANRQLENDGEFKGEIWHVHRNGTTFPTLMHNSLIKDETGNVAAMIATLGDITELKQAEETLQKANDTLEQHVEERTSQLQEANERLERVNTGLQVLIEHRQEEMRRLQENIMENVDKLVTPYLEKMDKRRMSAQNRAYLEVMASGLKELVSPFASTLSSKQASLSPTEIRVADLVRQGKTSKEIASLMNVSGNAITVHRYNIRRKLGLLNKKINLRSCLQSLPTQ